MDVEERLLGIRVRQSSLALSELQFGHKQGAETNEVVNANTKRLFDLFKRNAPRNKVS